MARRAARRRAACPRSRTRRSGCPAPAGRPRRARAPAGDGRRDRMPASENAPSSKNSRQPVVRELGRGAAPRVSRQQHRADTGSPARPLQDLAHVGEYPALPAAGARPAADPRSASPAVATVVRPDRRLPRQLAGAVGARCRSRACPAVSNVVRSARDPGDLQQRVLPGEDAGPSGGEQRAVDVPEDQHQSAPIPPAQPRPSAARLSASRRWARSTSSFWPHAGMSRTPKWRDRAPGAESELREARREHLALAAGDVVIVEREHVADPGHLVGQPRRRPPD